MPIEYAEKQAVFRDVVSVDEAEGLLEWLQDARSAEADLSCCSHLHPANLQVLMAAEIAITAWPENANLRAWLETALKSG